MEVPSPGHVLLEMAERADEATAELLAEAVDTYLQTEEDGLKPEQIEKAAEFCERHKVEGRFCWLDQAADYLTDFYGIVLRWQALGLLTQD